MDLSKLNDMQREAVLITKGPLLILAGAGSGKTRTVTYRIANLLETGVSPYHILALTFTNKAAKEMRERIEKLVFSSGVWISTFHSACVRILRKHIGRIGYSSSFTIYDDQDQLSLVGICLERLNIDDEMLPKRKALSIISEAKNRSHSPREYIEDRCSMDVSLKRMPDVFAEYQKSLKLNNALDFDDLLLLTIKLFEECKDVLEEYMERFKYIHVDEYQDTNLAQYTIVKMLSAKHKNICVVGDDDQGIYSWRGADIRNILEFEKDFPNAKVIRLEQNYRSTEYILNAANAVINNNASRKKKTLWTALGKGEKLTLHTAPDEHQEARFVCDIIKEGIAKGSALSDFAVLYRINAQSRVLEEMLRYNDIPHKIFGGVGFYQRKEIKDLIAYMRVVHNPADDVSLKRIINTPKRGIGNATVAFLEEAAEGNSISVFSVILNADTLLEEFRGRKKILEFRDLIKKLIALKVTLGLGDFTEMLIEQSGYAKQYETSGDEGRVRIENIREFTGAVREYEQSAGQDLAGFLESVALISDTDSLEEEGGYVSLMTMHSAKGLEFPTVFITGMEEGIFPHSRSIYSPEEMEEERRLCYVGITRARKKLYLTRCIERNLFGRYSRNMISRFLKEIPEEYIDPEQPLNTRSIYSAPKAKPAAREIPVQRTFTPAVKSPKDEGKYVDGARVSHKRFGEGVIIGKEGSGGSVTVIVDFDGVGEKRLALSFAPLEIL